jgi:hypothetical protein
MRSTGSITPLGQKTPNPLMQGNAAAQFPETGLEQVFPERGAGVDDLSR